MRDNICRNDAFASERQQAKYVGEILEQVSDVRKLIGGLLDGLHAAGFDCATSDETAIEYEVYCRATYAVHQLSRVSEVITGQPLPETGCAGLRRFSNSGIHVYCVVTDAQPAAAVMPTLMDEFNACREGSALAFDQIEAYYRKIVGYGHRRTAYALSQTCPQALVALSELWESLENVDWLAARWN